MNQINTHFSDLPFINIFVNKTDFILVGTQGDKLATVTWIMYLNEKELLDSHKFWPNVYNYQDSGGNYAFRALGFFLKILSSPSSNAVVERVFSIMNTVESLKVKNKV